MEKKKLSIWRILAYFTIYSFLGYIIETVFAIIFCGVIESRQSFLYGPFSGVYGAGAVILILTLKYFDKNNATIFLGGCIIGSITEYLINFIGEVVYDARWWDYSNKLLNLNGRICLQYTIFWGILSLILFKIINPQIDKFIVFIESKVSMNKLKSFATICTVLMVINIVSSAMAVNVFLTRIIVQNNIDVANKEEVLNEYKKVYGNDLKSKFIYKFWGDKKMILTYPNIRVQEKDGNVVYAHDLIPNVKPYLYKFNEK